MVNVVITEDTQKKVQELLAQRVCLGCGRQLEADEKTSLGQCATCYSATYRALLKGEVTREALMAEGKIANQPKGPKPKNDYTASLRARRS